MADVQEPFPQFNRKKGWFARNWWWVLLIVLIGGGVMCCGVCGLTGFIGLKALKETEPYKMTLAAVRSDPTVVERLGEPIVDDWKVNVQINATGGDRGSATVMIPISGPKGTARVRSECQMVGGTWGLTSVEVTFGDGQRHLLPIVPPPPGSGAGEAPPWAPTGESP